MPQPLALELKPQAPTRQLLAHSLWLATPTPLPLEATQLYIWSQLGGYRDKRNRQKGQYGRDWRWNQRF